jgi:hypothetical protein
MAQFGWVVHELFGRAIQWLLIAKEIDSDSFTCAYIRYFRVILNQFDFLM